MCAMEAADPTTARQPRNRDVRETTGASPPFLPLLLVSLLLEVAACAATPVRRNEVSAAAAAPPAATTPPPKVVSPDEQEPSVEGGIAWDAPSAPGVEEEIEKESAEIEELRKAEEASQVRGAQRVGADDETHPAGEERGRIALLPELKHDLATLQGEYDIPIEVNEAVATYVRFFQSTAARAHFVKWLGRSHRYLDRYRAILREEGIPEDTVYLAMIESGFGNFAYSRAKASGPWQFIPATGNMFGLKQDLWVDERRDPERSARAAARFLKQLYAQTGDWRLAWAGYNAGPRRILVAREKGYQDFWTMAAAPDERVLHPETKGYVPKLMAAAIISKHPEEFGFRTEEIQKQAWVEYAEVNVPFATLLSVLSRASGVAVRDLIELNPELRRACTPPRPYKLKIPAARAATFARRWPTVREKARMTFAGHVIRKGDTLSRIAHRYDAPAQDIIEVNDMRAGNKLRVGHQLLIPRRAGRVAVRGAGAATHARAVAMKARQPTARTDRTALRVRAGDTLWSIAKRFDVDLLDLCRWNGIKDPNQHKLLAGSRLDVYPEGG